MSQNFIVLFLHFLFVSTEQVLGKEQRLWLEDALDQSNAGLKLIVSSSVLIGNPDKKAS